jgi:ParB-like chromosome segregation protein Spo0J
VASAANVRRTGRTSNIGELAASIQAHGLLQNLTVRPVREGGERRPTAFASHACKSLHAACSSQHMRRASRILLPVAR